MKVTRIAILAVLMLVGIAASAPSHPKAAGDPPPCLPFILC